ncbi:hypothetical protein VDG1235_1291 [Verrucomicrobiia bacterium DG1235]|nr:hypothetical protein VDG1235_1291 [Verrucomicrobiae bacterium DG1235]
MDLNGLFIWSLLVFMIPIYISRVLIFSPFSKEPNSVIVLF